MTTYVAVSALVLAYLAIVAALVAMRTLARLRRDTYLLSRGSRGPDGQQSLIEAATRHAELAATAAEEVATLRAELDTLRRSLQAELASARSEALASLGERTGSEAGALRHVALVRYDAFGEMSGRMSFSLALLDDDGDGVTISALTGRSDTRVYAKAVSAGVGEHELSPEESQAVSSALGPRPRFRKAG